MEDTYKNYTVIQTMLMESTKLLRQLFLDSWKEINGYDWGDNEESAKYFQTNGKSILKQCFKEQKPILESGKSGEFDISLYRLILTSDIFLQSSASAKIPSVQKLVEIRNKMNHRSTMIITDKEFKESTEQLSIAMIDLGAIQATIDKLIQNKDIRKDLPTNKDAANIKLRANEEFKNKNYDKAIELYTSALILTDLTNQEVGILYSNRSLAYIKKFENSKDERDLYRALSDANQTCSHYPTWYKGYARLGEIYFLMNELNQSKENYEKALTFKSNDQDISNSLAYVKRKINEQIRQEHLDEAFLPCTPTESKEMGLKIAFQHFNNSKLDELSQGFDRLAALLEKQDPTMKDVWKGHEYRDGSETLQQNYEMAAKYYGKAAQKNNAEALYNLALLTMKGLGVKKDYSTAISLLKQAAAQKPTRPFFNFEIANVGVAEAEHSLGLAYHNGIYVVKNETAAAKWYNLAIEHGHASAANNLGAMYLHGTGVEKDYRKCEKLLMLAHERGDPNGSINLVDLYIEERDPDRALMWHERSLEGKSLYPKTRDQEIREVIKALKKLKDACNERAEVNPNIKSIQEHLHKMSLVSDSTKNCISMYSFDRNELNESALKGSITASKMIDAFDHFQKAVYLLENVRNYDIDEFIFNLYYGYTTEEKVCQLNFHLVEKIVEIVKNVLDQNKNRRSDIDYQSRICFAYLNNGDSSFMVNFLTLSLQLYPNDAQMLKLRGSNYIKLRQFEKALKDCESISELHPNGFENIYNRAVTLKLMSTKASLTKSIYLFEQFISKAPIDHCHIPEAYYSIATCLGTLYMSIKTDDNLEKILYYYNKGIEAEKNQLSCFMPYRSNTKTYVESLMQCLKDLGRLNLPQTSTICSQSPKNNELPDPHRIEVVKAHRNSIRKFSEQKLYLRKGVVSIKNTYQPNKKQTNANQFTGLKKISLNDIDFAKDHILNGYILTVSNFDIPIIGVFPSVHFIIKENEFVRKLCIYNLGNNFDSIREKFPIGCIFSIINPYIRLATDGKPMIRVDDPNTIIFSGRIIENMCRYCGKEDSKYSCSKCKVAKYCSKECQSNDWNLLDHKDICSNLINIK